MGNWTSDLRARLARLRLSPAREAEVVEELSQHLDDRYDELLAAGSSDADARRLALAELNEAGGLAHRMHALSQAHTPPPVVHGQPNGGLLRGSWQDLRSALRTMRRQPGFAATIVVTLAVGIAVNTTVFTIVNAAVLRSMPITDAERVVRLSVANIGNAEDPEDRLSYLDLQDWRTAHSTFEDIQGTAERSVALSGDERPAARVNAAYVSWNTFSLIGQPPALGRDFAETDDREGGQPVVILGSSLWRARYGGDPSIVGKTVRVGGVPSTVVGVMPPRFGFPDNSELWLPFVALPQEERTSRSTRRLDAMGWLRPGVTVEQATTELSGITASLASRYPDTNRNTAPIVEPLGIAGPIIAATLALLGAVVFVQLIACANVANLMLARAADRSRDITLRMALGASRWRIRRQLLVESLVLATAGGVCGLALSYPGVQVFRNLPANSAPPYWVQFTIDGMVFSYFAAVCVVSALVCGLVPAWHASRTTLAATLNDAGRGSAGSRSRRRWTGAFVIAQVTAALVLLTGAAMMMQNLIGLVRIDVGVETTSLMQMAFEVRRTDDTPERRLLFFSQLEERLASSSGVSAALTSNAPIAGARVLRLRIDGRPGSEVDALPFVSLVRVGQGYFDVVGARVIDGRAFTADDLLRRDGLVINERFARMHFQNEPAIGKRLLLIDENAPAAAAGAARWMTIVGVVGNVRQRSLPSGEFDPVVYASYAEDPPPFMQIIARSAAGPAAAATFVREQMRALDPDLPLFGMTTVDELLANQQWPQRLFGSMFAVFASIAMLLATSGLYAVTAYAVSRRTREIGVRVALGADARSIWWAVTGTTVRQLAIGLVLGSAGAAAVARVLPAFLVGTGGANRFAFAGVAVVFLAVGILASAVPARRAMRLDPVTALQTD
ncbi:MAG TPA: ABC transporter permease [Vicinamibacterales bacterium]|nr:ABC transporter permease [Vicinamibacterales bacterium]